MHEWGYRVAAPFPVTRDAFVAVMEQLGYAPATGNRASAWTLLVEDGDGGTLLTVAGTGSEDIGEALSTRLRRPAVWVEIDLFDSYVHGSRCAIEANGRHGVEEDLDEEATGLCEEWFEGGKYRTEIAGALVAVLLGLEDEPGGGVREVWTRTARPDIEVAPAPKPPPPQFRRFRHADGRDWQIRVHDNRLELRMSPDGADWVERSRRYADAASAAREGDGLIADQLGDGFVEVHAD